MLQPRSSVIFRLTAAVGAASLALPPGPCPGIDFAHDVVPLITKHCGECHTGDARQGGFSMNTRDDLTEPGPIRKILTHLGEPLEPPPVSPARGPPTEWGELVQVHDDRDVFQGRIDELPVFDIHSL